MRSRQSARLGDPRLRSHSSSTTTMRELTSPPWGRHYPPRRPEATTKSRSLQGFSLAATPSPHLWKVTGITRCRKCDAPASGRFLDRVSALWRTGERPPVSILRPAPPVRRPLFGLPPVEPP